MAAENGGPIHGASGIPDGASEDPAGERVAMKTQEIIKKLREMPAVKDMGTETRQLMYAAADRLEELDERMDIMRESMDAEWGNSY